MKLIGALLGFVWKIVRLAIITFAIYLLFATFITTPKFINHYYFPETPLADLVKVLPPQVQSSIDSITIFEDNDPHLRGASAHCHNGEICFSRSALKDYCWAIWHEAAHAYHRKLELSYSDFSFKWRSVSGAVLTMYGETDYAEDIAVWVEEFYLEIGGYPSEFDKFWWRRYVFGMESYRRKLELLREYGFISEADYRKFLELNPCFKE